MQLILQFVLSSALLNSQRVNGDTNTENQTTHMNYNLQILPFSETWWVGHRYKTTIWQTVQLVVANMIKLEHSALIDFRQAWAIMHLRNSRSQVCLLFHVLTFSNAFRKDDG